MQTFQHAFTHCVHLGPCCSYESNSAPCEHSVCAREQLCVRERENLMGPQSYTQLYTQASQLSCMHEQSPLTCMRGHAYVQMCSMCELAETNKNTRDTKFLTRQLGKRCRGKPRCVPSINGSLSLETCLPSKLAEQGETKRLHLLLEAFFLP